PEIPPFDRKLTSSYTSSSASIFFITLLGNVCLIAMSAGGGNSLVKQVRHRFASILARVLRVRFGVTGVAVAAILAIALSGASGWAQTQPEVSLETSETLFTVLSAINTCGYDQELSISDPLRMQIRSEVGKAVEDTAGTRDVIGPMCLFYQQHQTSDPARDLSMYVSLALYLEEPPTFTLKVKPGELPPDAAVAADILPLMQAFYQKIGLHAIWERHRDRYAELTEIYHAPLAKMTFDTEIYL